MVFEKVRKLVAKELGIAEEEIKETTTFQDLGIDSLEVFEVVMALEDEFHLEIPNEDIEDITSIAEITKYVQSKLR